MSSCPHLEQIDLYECGEITLEGVNPQLKCLKTIELGESSVTDVGLRNFMLGCPGLEQVYIDRTQISDELRSDLLQKGIEVSE